MWMQNSAITSTCFSVMSWPSSLPTRTYPTLFLGQTDLSAQPQFLLKVLISRFIASAEGFPWGLHSLSGVEEERVVRVVLYLHVTIGTLTSVEIGVALPRESGCPFETTAREYSGAPCMNVSP